MAAESTVKVVFLGDASKLKAAIGDVDAATGKAEGGFSTLGKAIGGAVAVGGAVDLAKGAFDAAMESQKIAAQTEAAIKSTGSAAGVTAKQVGDLAGSLSMKNGVDDEAIQTGQNLLLTFTNIQNKAGEGNDIFDQSTQVMIDMAAAMGTDVAGGAIQLGKALNDPTEGLSALTRVGVTFTEEQKAQIKAMQASGNMAGAQKVILAELTKEFGGSAAAQATATDRMKIAMGNLQEAIGAKLIPVVERFSTWMVAVGIPAMQRFVDWIDANVIPVVERMGEIIGAVIAAVADWWREHWDQIRTTAETVINAVQTIVETVLGAIEAFWRTWGGNITTVVTGLFDGIRDYIQGIIDVIRGIIQTVMALIHGDWDGAWKGIKLVLEGIWESIKGIVEAAIALVRGAIEAGMRLIAGVFDAAWDGIKAVFSAAWGWLKDEALGFFTGLAGALFFAVMAAGAAIAHALWDGIKATLEAVWDLGGWLLHALATAIDAVIDGALGIGKRIVEAIVDGIKSAPGAIAGAIGGLMPGGIHIPGTSIDIGIPGIPGLAAGGIVTRPTLAVVGEAGPEAVVPLSKLGNMGGPTMIFYITAPDRSTGDYAAQSVAASVRRELAVSLRGAVA